MGNCGALQASKDAVSPSTPINNNNNITAKLGCDTNAAKLVEPYIIMRYNFIIAAILSSLFTGQQFQTDQMLLEHQEPLRVLFGNL